MCVGVIDFLCTSNVEAKLNGTIPTQIARLVDLTVLNLASNQLSGTVPSALAQLSKLTRLDLSRSAVSGAFPALPKAGNLTSCALRDTCLDCRSVPSACTCTSACTCAPEPADCVAARSFVTLKPCALASCAADATLDIYEGDCVVLHQCLAPHLGVAAYARASFQTTMFRKKLKGITRFLDSNYTLQLYNEPDCRTLKSTAAGQCGTCDENFQVDCFGAPAPSTAATAVMANAALLLGLVASFW
jgi:hypothetical protein